MVSIVDDGGYERTGSVEVTVTSDPPVADFSFGNPPDVWPSDAAPRTVRFDGTASSDDRGIASYSWKFMDSGTTVLGSTATRTFDEPGTYPVRLVVYDREGQSDSVTKNVVVTPAPEPDPEAVRITEQGLQLSYAPGDSASGTITIEMDDPEFTVRRAVAFLNVVEAEPPYAQAVSTIASSGSAQPEIFNVVHEHAALEAGITTTVTFQLRPDAPPGDYSVVIQLFAGTNTDPNNVNVNDRFALRAFPLTIE